MPKRESLITTPFDYEPSETTADFSNIQTAILNLEEIKDCQMPFIEAWTNEIDLSAEERGQRKILFRKIKNILEKAGEAAVAVRNNEMTWKKLSEDVKFKNLLTNLRNLLRTDSLDEYLKNEVNRRLELGEEGTNEKNLFLPNEYIDPNEFSFEQIEKANAIIVGHLEELKNEAENEHNDKLAKNIDILQTFLSDKKMSATAERDTQNRSLAGVDLVWLKVAQPIVWNALCVVVKEKPVILRLILGEPTVYSQHEIGANDEFEENRQKEMLSALPNIINLTILKTASLSESDDERERLNSQELLKEFYGANLPQELDSGDMLVLKVEIENAFKHIKDEKVRELLTDGISVIRSRFSKIKKVAEFRDWPRFFEFFTQYDNIKNLPKSIMGDIPFYLYKMLTKCLDTTLNDLAVYEGARNAPDFFDNIFFELRLTFGRGSISKRMEETKVLPIFYHQCLRWCYGKRDYKYSISPIFNSLLFSKRLLSYVSMMQKIKKQMRDNPEWTKFFAPADIDQLQDLSDLNFTLSRDDLNDVGYPNFNDQNISGFNFSDCTFSSRENLARCNPDGACFANAKNLALWIQAGMSEDGVYLHLRLEKSIRDGLKHLGDANLEQANLNGVNLEGADLRYANLENANMQNANLKGADLRDANLKNVNFTGAKLDEMNLLYALKKFNL